MSSYTYWPYDEVTLNKNHEANTISIQTPWLQATTSASLIADDNFSDLQNKLNQQLLTAADLHLVNNFFSHFDDYPFSYILPAPKSERALDKHGLIDENLLEQNLDDILSSLFSHLNTRKLAALLSRCSWEWDAQAAILFASINGKVHPESLFSVARRYHLLELLSNDKGKEFFAQTVMAEKETYLRTAIHIVRQNHYVTEKCQQALAPALQIAGQARELVSSFMKEEKGHDRILKKSLQHLGVEPENVAPSLQVQALMHLLEYIAGKNFLGFAMAIDAFERNNYEEVDPIAKLLIAGGYEKSADYLNRHMKINDNGGHENIAQSFLQHMDLCDEKYALEALRLMELVSLIMCQLSKNEG